VAAVGKAESNICTCYPSVHDKSGKPLHETKAATHRPLTNATNPNPKPNLIATTTLAPTPKNVLAASRCTVN
jgi:hypothetical protein